MTLSVYPFQERVKSALFGGRSVILQAPTGSGKTRAALSPYIEAFFDMPDHVFRGSASTVSRCVCWLTSSLSSTLS